MGHILAVISRSCAMFWKRREMKKGLFGAQLFVDEGQGGQSLL